MASRALESPAQAFGPGWDRQSRWSLRFSDPGLERSYLTTMAGAGRQRLRIACLAGAALWAQSAILGPPLLNIPAAPVYAAALIAGGGHVIGTWLSRRP